MSPQPTGYLSVLFLCRRGHKHQMCLPITHSGVPPQLQCPAPSGTSNHGSGCPLPSDYENQIRRAMRGSLQEWLRLGYLVIRDQ